MKGNFKFYRKLSSGWQLVGKRDLESLSAALGVARVLGFVCSADILFENGVDRPRIVEFNSLRNVSFYTIVGHLFDNLTPSDL